LKVSVPAA